MQVPFDQWRFYSAVNAHVLLSSMFSIQMNEWPEP